MPHTTHAFCFQWACSNKCQQAHANPAAECAPIVKQTKPAQHHTWLNTWPTARPRLRPLETLYVSRSCQKQVRSIYAAQLQTHAHHGAAHQRSTAMPTAPNNVVAAAPAPPCRAARCSSHPTAGSCEVSQDSVMRLQSAGPVPHALFHPRPLHQAHRAQQQTQPHMPC